MGLAVTALAGLSILIAGTRLLAAVGMPGEGWSARLSLWAQAGQGQGGLLLHGVKWQLPLTLFALFVLFVVTALQEAGGRTSRGCRLLGLGLGAGALQLVVLWVVAVGSVAAGGDAAGTGALLAVLPVAGIVGAVAVLLASTDLRWLRALLRR